MYVVYILRSQVKEKYYIGYTADIVQRLANHNIGGTPSTKPYRPWVVVYAENQSDKKSAWLRERQIKRYKGGEAFKKLIHGEVAERLKAGDC